MYGLVHDTFRAFVSDKLSAGRWAEMLAECELDERSFVTMQAYDDEVTYKLLLTGARYLETEPAEMLHDFGVYWVNRADASEWYYKLLDAGGDSLPELLANLDQLHGRVRAQLPKLRPPSFQCLDVSDESLRVRYYSQREGLTTLVQGLLIGIGRRFGTEVEVEIEQTKEDGAPFDQYLVRYV